MLRQSQAQAQGQGRRIRLRSGSLIMRLIWVTGYFSVTLAALLSTYLFPALLSGLRSELYTSSDRLLKGDSGLPGFTSSEMSWKQENLPPHLSRWMNSQENPLQQKETYRKLWKPPVNRGFGECVDPSPRYTPPGTSKGYLLVSSNGGLNQMRAGICDMVAIARIINATLVVPELDTGSFWQDSSNFSDIFDVNHFIKALEKDVEVVVKLPEEYRHSPKASKQFRSWSGMEYYEEDIASLWEDHKVIKAVKTDSRLANNDLPADIQKLRCRVHYDALQFAPRIKAFGEKLVERMRADGPYIALHLRYEKDMLAFSGCTHGLTEEEAEELTRIREETKHWRVKEINSTEQREKGFCPLTPREVGIFLSGLGYPNETRIYIAAGEIYGGQKRMEDLRSHFPNLMRKETIASREELAPFAQHASQMAALDYIVSVASDVFVPSYSGNMARAVEGHRRFNGHLKTIIPDRKELVALFDKLDRGELTEGDELSAAITELHRRRQGGPRKRKGPLSGSRGKDRFRTEEAFYTNPNPDCICQKASTAGEQGKGGLTYNSISQRHDSKGRTVGKKGLHSH